MASIGFDSACTWLELEIVRGFRGFFTWKVRSELQLWLLLQKGDIIDVVQMNKSGLWKGVLHNRIGHFKFINVEILNDRVPRRGEPEGRGKWGQRYRQKPGSVQELLQRMNLQVESNILPRLEQTDSHLHRFECKAGKPAFIRFFIRLDLSLFIHIPPPRLASLACTFYIAYNTQFHENLACSFFCRHFFFFSFFFISIFLLSLSHPIDFPLAAFISFLSCSRMLPVMNVQLPSLVNVQPLEI